MDDNRRAYTLKDGRQWLLGIDSDVSWIRTGTNAGRSIASAIPLIYEAYATIAIDPERATRTQELKAVYGLLASMSQTQEWWLGFLETGADDVVFPGETPVQLYADWPYRVVLATYAETTIWRTDPSSWKGPGPDLVFPDDRSWLLSWMWDDDWFCFGGSTHLVEGLIGLLPSAVRRVSADEDISPAGDDF